jgi:hypothetical protein
MINLPLVGATFEPKPATLSIAAGRGDDLIVHVIQDPAHLWMAGAKGRTDAAMEIEAADGAQTILRFTHEKPK